MKSLVEQPKTLTLEGDYVNMMQLNFENKETEDYFYAVRRNLGVAHPTWWNSAPVITKEDVENYIKDSENILQC